MYIPIVLVACLVLGYILKKWLPMDNKWIPTILVVVGAVLGCLANKDITLIAVAGGGGWYGGCGAYPDGSGDDDRAGGGGSGYVYTSSTASNYPSGCLLNTAYYLTNAATIAGNTSFTDYSGSTTTGHSDNGACRITALKTINNSVYIKKNGVWQQAAY